MGIIHSLKYEGVEGIRIGRFNLGINTTCIVYRIGKTILDTGSPNQWSVIRKFLQEKNINRVLITHHHEDHSGNAANINREMKASVFAPPRGILYMAQGFPLRLYQRIFWGTPFTFEPESVPNDIELENGLRLKTLHTPGHSIDMTCYLESERGWLFSGDLFVAKKPRYLRNDENLNEEIQSLRQILKYDFNTVFCAHRGIISNGKQAIQDKLDYLESIRNQVRTLYKAGIPINEITHRLLGKEDLMTWGTTYHFSKRNLIEACLSSES